MHPDIRITQACSENMPPIDFSSLADEHPELVTGMHSQVRLMVNFGLNGSISWLKDTEGIVGSFGKGRVQVSMEAS